MPTCPNGHDSQDSDFCGLCGIRIGSPPATSPAAGSSSSAGFSPAGSGPGGSGLPSPDSASSPASAAVPPAPSGESCPMCGATRTGQFCEGCGFDFAAAPSPPVTPAPTASSTATSPASSAPESTTGAAAAGTWTAVVTADREYFDRVQSVGGPDADAIEFPAYCPERRFSLTGREMRIGRRSASRGLEPEIDLTGPPADPGISRLHAVLTAEPDGGWAVLDPGSANGTQVNGREIPPGERVPLHDGDRICVGGWTALTIAAG